jgi:hypothetical protein
MDIPLTDGSSQPFNPPPNYSQPQVSGSMGSSSAAPGESAGVQRSDSAITTMLKQSR